MHSPPAGAALGLCLLALLPAGRAEEPAATPRQGKLEFRVEPLTYAYYIREPGARHPHLSFSVRGEAAAEVRAARVIITKAMDDTGRELQGPHDPKFLRIAVGSVSREEYLRPIPPSIACDLSAVAPEAKALKRVEGKVELVIPAMHADAIALIENVPAHTGVPVESEPLRKAGITLEILDRQAYEARMATYRDLAGGLTEYGLGAFLPADILATMSPKARAEYQKIVDEQLARSPLPQFTDRDLALAIHDPEERLVGIEFVAGNKGLVYNRNGTGHYENTVQKKRLAVYHLEDAIPADLKLVCWLVIDRSLVRIPFEMIDVPLPPAKAPAAKAPAATPDVP